jgi:hypothetical protein
MMFSLLNESLPRGTVRRNGDGIRPGIGKGGGPSLAWRYYLPPGDPLVGRRFANYNNLYVTNSMKFRNFFLHQKIHNK